MNRRLARWVAVIVLNLAVVAGAVAGNCLEFTDSGDYATGSGIPTTLTNLTLEAWVYHHAITNRTERYVTLGSEVAVIRHDGVSSPGQLHFYIKTGGSLRALRADGVLTNRVWHHVAGTWDGTTMRLYLDGLELTNSAPGGTLDALDGNVKIGRDSNEWLNGRIDEARVWSAARTEAEIQRGMRVGLNGTESGLAAYWRLDEASGTTAEDSAGDCDLTLHGNARFAGSMAPVAHGGSGGGGNVLAFSMANGYVNIGNDPSLDVGNSLTVEAWVKPFALNSRFGVFSTRFNNTAGSFQLEVGIGNGTVSDEGRVGVSGPGTWVAQTGNDVIQVDQWAHIAYVRTGTNGTDTIYVNGVAQAVVTNSAYVIANNTSDKVIGAGTSGGQLYSGLIDGLRVWNAARTEAQIRDDMHLAWPADATGLAACYTFDMAGGATLPDLTTNGNHGALVSMGEQYWWASAAPLAIAMTNMANTRGVWDGNTNSLASSRLSVTNAAVAEPNNALVGHDGGADSWQSADVPPGIVNRLTRVWRGEASGSVTGRIAFGTASLGDVGDFRLLVSADGGFSNAAVVSGTYSDAVFTVSARALSNGVYYTLGSAPFSQMPGASLPTLYDTASAWGDYDNDGHLDFIISGLDPSLDATNPPVAFIYHNNGDGTFTKDVTASAGIAGVGRGTVAWGDYDNDGRIDLLLAGDDRHNAMGYSYSQKTRIYHNNSDGTFTEDTAADAGIPGIRFCDAVWGDYDNDGWLDFIIAGSTSAGGVTRIYHNNGDRTFTRDTAAAAGIPGLSDASAAWGDFNNDGRLDLLLAGNASGSRIARIYRNDPAPDGPGRAVFTNIQAGLTGSDLGAADWGDYDNDGWLDFVLVGHTNNVVDPLARMYHNNGDGTFSQNTAAGLPTKYTMAVEWGDTDNDGRLDLLLQCTDATYICRNNGDGTFSDINAGLPGKSPDDLWNEFAQSTWGDCDNDGRLDLLIPEIAGVFRNVLPPGGGPSDNARPGAPANLRAAIFMDESEFRWDAASDAETPAGGLTYNLRVGTTPGGGDVFAGMADPTNGFRRVAAMGNVWHNHVWTLPALPRDRTYYWSVQAVDGGLAGGSWAAESVFTPQNYPEVTTVPVSGSGPDIAEAGGDVTAGGASAVTARGICWNTSGFPTPDDSHTDEGGGTGGFTSTLTGLVEGQTYYVRSYAVNGDGTSYGAQRAFTFTATPPGYLLVFSGESSQYVAIADAGDLDVTTNYTLECWFKPDGVTGAQGLVSKSQVAGDSGWYLRLNDSEVAFDGLATGGLGLQSNVWYHLAAVNDDGTRHLYVNGVEQSLTGTPVAVQANTNRVTLASDQKTNYFSGRMDEVRIWNTVRSEPEVRENMHLIAGGLDGLVANYSFDVPRGTRVEDQAQATTLHPGTFVNMTGTVWAASTIPAGRGAAQSGTEAVGEVAFTNAGLTATFTAAGSASLTATRIDAGPLRPGPSACDLLSPCWVVESYPDASFAADLAFTVHAGLTAADEANPSLVTLFRRDAMSDGVWTQAATAVSVSAANQTATFTNVTAFGQFAIGRAGVWEQQTFPGVSVDGSPRLAWGDYDRDGDLDTIISSYDKTGIYRNNGDGTFTEDTVADAALPAFKSGAVIWGDFDSDGRLDIAVAGVPPDDNCLFKVYHNNADGSFTENTNSVFLQTGPLKGQYGGASWGDYDNDGRLDLLFMGQDDGTNYGPRLYHNDGNGVFTEDTRADTNLVSLTAAYGMSVWGDYDNDGRLDLLVVGSSGYSGSEPGRYTGIFRNNSDGTFTEDTVAGAGLPQLGSASAAWGDYDNDGWLDFVIAGNTISGGAVTRIYHNNGDGTFTRNTAASLAQKCMGTVAWGDYNNDGRLDLLQQGSDDTIGGDRVTKLYRNDGAGVFTEVAAGFVDQSYGQAAWGDFNNDGALDVLVTGIDGSQYITYLYANRCAITNTPPGAPSGLDAAVSSNTVTLSWNAASDAQTPVAGLSHNVRVGAAPGASDVFFSHADDGSGWRRLPALGNANLNRAWTLALPENGGTFYWSVQAVDGALAGGAWAAEGSFTLPLPAVVTAVPTNVTGTTAGYGGEVASEGATPVTARGVCWSTNSSPTLADNVTSNGTGAGVFSGTLTDLTPGQTYYVRAYAVNSHGTAYGSQQSFTASHLPVVSTAPMTTITGTTAGYGGEVTGEGTPPVTARGVCWSTNSSPTLADNVTSDGTGPGVFSGTLTDLTPGQTYTVRAYATNSYGVSYGTIKTFTTLYLPVVSTAPMSNISGTTAGYGGEVASEGATPVTVRGVCWSTNSSPTLADNVTSDGTGAGVFSGTLTDLTPGQSYHVRAYATNSHGTTYGTERIFAATLTPPGSTLAFDGTNGFVNVGHGTSLDVGNVLTIEAWIKADNLAARYGVFSTRRDNDDHSFQLEVGTSGGSTNCVTVTAPNTTVAQTANEVIASGQWTHIAYVRSSIGAAYQQIYVNGVAQSLATSVDYAFQNNDSDKVIGEGTSGGQHFPGRMDEVRVWRVARTQDQIRDTMHKQLTGGETGLVAYYAFNQLSGSAVIDATANYNTGTLTAAVWVASSIPCADLCATNDNVRGAWIARTNSLASSILSVSNAATVGEDFRIFGHDGGALAVGTADKPAGYEWRLSRAWQTEGTGVVSGALSFDCSAIAGSINDPALLRLMVSADATFADAAGVAGSYAGNVFTVAGQALPTNGWYTIGERLAANWVIVASAGPNGTIAPAGNIPVAPGGTTNFVITPADYHHVADVATNGASVGAVTAFTWNNVTADGAIHATFAADLAAQGTPHWWLAGYGLTNGGWTFNEAEADDTDEDTFDANSEYIADTDPTNAASYFAITGTSNLPPWTVYFRGSSNRLYALHGISNLVGGVWTNVPGAGPRAGVGGNDSLSDTNQPPAGPFYRMKVQLP